MKKTKNIINTDLDLLASKEWYHQRFDGALFFLGSVSQPELVKEKRKLTGGNFTKHLCFFHQGGADWLILQDDISRISELIFRKSFNLRRITDKKIIFKLNDMEKKNGLIKINFPGLTDKAWYHQQADGLPFTMEAIAEPYTEREDRREGYNYKHIFIFFKDKLGHWYHDLDDIKRISLNIAQRARSEGNINQNLMKNWKADENNFVIKSKALDNLDFADFSSEELRKKFINYCETYFRAFSSSSIIDGFALGTDELIQQEISLFLKNRGLEKEQYKYFTILTAPVNQSFISEAELSLLQVADLVVRGKEFKKALAMHARKYFWIKNNYNSAYVLAEGDFMKEIKGLIKGTGQGINFQAEIERINSTPVKNKAEKEKLIAEINLPKYICNLITISEDFTYWQDERKKRTFWFTHYGFRFLQEIGHRFGYNVEELKYFVYPEVVALLDGKGTVSRAEALARKRGCLFYHQGDEYEVVTGAEAKKFKKEIFDKASDTEVNDFRGMPASRGRVRGRVKVLMSAREIGKIQAGDILVAVMTRPDYIAGLKKAAAIVTDEGGVTCHAAIVSRELGIPCVIGTKIATKVLHDGDEIEVNANHGVVTIIHKA